MHANDSKDRMQEAINAYCDSPTDATRQTALQAIKESLADDRAAGIVPEPLPEGEALRRLAESWQRVPEEKRELFTRRAILVADLFCDPALDL